ncbi:hypothetical protein C8Q70DRAFT_739191 [Cubamyces menziesii]|nr:hypothetical protein C8Q70DRAFT_739191 [Cubamyces menziesii]
MDPSPRSWRCAHKPIRSSSRRSGSSVNDRQPGYPKPSGRFKTQRSATRQASHLDAALPIARVACAKDLPDHELKFNIIVEDAHTRSCTQHGNAPCRHECPGGLQTRDAVHYQGTSELRPHSARTVKGVPGAFINNVHHAATYHKPRLRVVLAIEMKPSYGSARADRREMLTIRCTIWWDLRQDVPCSQRRRVYGNVLAILPHREPKLADRGSGRGKMNSILAVGPIWVPGKRLIIERAHNGRRDIGLRNQTLSLSHYRRPVSWVRPSPVRRRPTYTPTGIRGGHWVRPRWT